MLLPDPGDIHDQYLALASLGRGGERDALAGRLLLRAEFSPAGIAVVLASSIAGAAALCIDADAELLRNGLRHGLCDFVVGQLDEALRILKNEIRRGRAVSVCLTAEPAACVGEMADRGIQPDLLSLDLSSAASQSFLARGAAAVPTAHPAPETQLLFWSAASEPARALPELARIASECLDEGLPDTPARRHWLFAAPRRLGRSLAGQPCLRMTADEATAFRQRAEARLPEAGLLFRSR